MNYNLQTEDRGHYLYIAFLGNWTKDNGDQVLNQIYSTAVASGRKAVLTDFCRADLLETLTLDEYEEAISASQLPDIHFFKFAGLHQSGEAYRFEFWVTVASNRGIRVRSFETERDAVGWLVSDETII